MPLFPMNFCNKKSAGMYIPTDYIDNGLFHVGCSPVSFETGNTVIGEGMLLAGDRLLAAKELVASLDVNLHMVLRAYQMLRDEGLIELRRGRGAIVIASDLQMSKLTTLADDLVAQAQRLGVSRDELARIILEGEADE